MARLTLLNNKVVALDSVIFIYALENHPEFGEISLEVFENIEQGLLQAVACDLTLAELIVQPLKLGRKDVAERYIKQLRVFPNLRFLSLTQEVIIEAAYLRAKHNVGMVDALHIACVSREAKVFITNDRRLKKDNLGVEVMLLDDLV